MASTPPLSGLIGMTLQAFGTLRPRVAININPNTSSFCHESALPPDPRNIVATRSAHQPCHPIRATIFATRSAERRKDDYVREDLVTLLFHIFKDVPLIVLRNPE
jgi:hypothetical protein